jgi:DNA-binding response OmpR family regulator
MQRPLRVLVVDDNRDIVTTTMLLLSIEGYEPKPCYSGAEVFDCVKEHDPDVVLMDIGLPGQSGWECAKQIRAKIPGKRPVLVAITGEFTKSADKMRSELSGFDYYLVKPSDPKVLFAILAKVKQEHR